MHSSVVKVGGCKLVYSRHQGRGRWRLRRRKKLILEGCADMRSCSFVMEIMQQITLDMTEVSTTERNVYLHSKVLSVPRSEIQLGKNQSASIGLQLERVRHGLAHGRNMLCRSTPRFFDAELSFLTEGSLEM